MTHLNLQIFVLVIREGIAEDDAIQSCHQVFLHEIHELFLLPIVHAPVQLRVGVDTIGKFRVKVLNHFRLVGDGNFPLGHKFIDERSNQLGNVQRRFLFQLLTQEVGEFIPDLVR